MQPINKNLFIITGASTGFGRALCKRFSTSSLFPLPETKYILLSRNVEGMNETREMMKQQFKQSENNYENNVDVVECDLSNLTNLQQTLTEKVFPVKQDSDQVTYEHIILVHNAGSLGPLKYVHELSDQSPVVQECVDMNVTASFILVSNFLNFIKSNKIQSKKIWIVNISSLLAVYPYESWSLYCVTKSARKMLCDVIAKENASDERLKVLSYQPGPLAGTDMSLSILENGMSHKANEQYYQDLLANNKYIPCEDSADKLITLLTDDCFSSGSSIDYYDT